MSEREWESDRANPLSLPVLTHPSTAHHIPGLTDATYKRLPLPQIISHLIQFPNALKHLPNSFSKCFLSLIIYDLIQCRKKKREETRIEEKRRKETKISFSSNSFKILFWVFWFRFRFRLRFLFLFSCVIVRPLAVLVIRHVRGLLYIAYIAISVGAHRFKCKSMQ